MAHASGRGRFVTLEGVDGAGKSTHIPWIADRLRALGHAVLVTREPGGTPLAEELRGFVLSRPMDPVTETLLLFAARADHVREMILPALERGQWVLCDRFSDATLAYQGAGKGVSRALIEQLAQAAHGALQPDRTLVFDCPYEVSRARLESAGRKFDRFEAENREFFERVRSAYARLSHDEPQRVRRIDASRSIEEIRAELRSHLSLEAR